METPTILMSIPDGPHAFEREGGKMLVSYLAYSDYVIILFSLDSYCVLVFQQDS